MEGWIKIYRTCLDHWLYNEYRPLTKREAWENILIWANFADSSVLIKGQLIECKRGQLLYSIETYASKFVWSTGQVRSFFELLKKDKMITIEGLKYTTRLTICNYDKYQDKQQAHSELPTTSEQTDDKLTTTSEQTDDKLTTTRKESKEEKENKELNISFEEFWNAYDKKVGNKDKLIEKWEKLKDSDRVEIMDYITNYKQSQPDKKYRKNPLTFFNNVSWKDEIIFNNDGKLKKSLQPAGFEVNNKTGLPPQRKAYVE